MWIANSKADYGWLSGGGVAGPASYAETNSDPNVKALWKFNEASGDLVDSVNGITCVDPAGYAGEDLTYGVTSSGLFAGISPGVTLGTISSNPYFAKLSATTQLNVGASDHVVIEMFADRTATGDMQFSSILGAAAPNGANFGIYINLTSTTKEIVFKADDGTAVVLTGALVTTIADGNMHKYRVVFNRSGNLELFIDGVSQGSTSMAGVSGKVITCQSYNLTSSYTGGATNRWVGTISTIRVSIGTNVLSNNLGGPGGG